MRITDDYMNIKWLKLLSLQLYIHPLDSKTVYSVKDYANFYQPHIR